MSVHSYTQDVGVHAARELVHGQGVGMLYYDMYRSVRYLVSYDS